MFDVFIQGETICLCPPSEEIARRTNWYRWYNDQKICEYLRHGLYPNTVEKQVEHFNNLPDDTLLLMVVNGVTNDRQLIGIVSLMHINERAGAAEFALAIGEHHKPYETLEATSLLLEHGFEVIGLDRIWAGQAYELKKWNQKMEILGFRNEAVIKNGFRRGHKIQDSVIASVLRETFEPWTSVDDVMSRINNLPKKGFSELMREELDRLWEGYRVDTRPKGRESYEEFVSSRLE